MVSGLLRCHWSSASPIRSIFRKAFANADVPYFNPHSFRNTLVQLGEELCNSPEEFKAWSQNLGHEKALTTFLNYGEIACHRQGEILQHLAAPRQAARSDANEIAEAVLKKFLESPHISPATALITKSYANGSGEKLNRNTLMASEISMKAGPLQANRYEFIDSGGLASRWCLPESWIREQVRTRSSDPIPHVRFGKYVRFRWGSPELEQWAERRIVSAIAIAAMRQFSEALLCSTCAPDSSLKPRGPVQ